MNERRSTMQAKVVQTRDEQTDEAYVDLGSLKAYVLDEVDRARRGETLLGVRLA